MQPTDSELEILKVLWKRHKCTVREVHDDILKNKDIGYTTTLKTLQVMLSKGLVERNSNSKAHFYKAAINETLIENNLLKKMIDAVFNGSYSNLILRALGNSDVTNEEIIKIEEHLDKLKNNDK